MRVSVILLLASALISRADENAAGRWEGSVQIPGRQLKLVVDLAAENGSWQGSLTIPGLGLQGAPLSNVALNGNDIVFATKTALADQRNGPAEFNGHFAGDGKIEGDFVQAGNSAPFALEKTGPAQLEAAPHSTAVAKQIEGEWKGEYKLFDYPRKVAINLRNSATQGATAEFVIVGRRVNKLPVDRVVQQGEFVTVDSHETGLSFEGRARKGEIEGTIFQGALEIPVTLHRTN